MKTSVLSSNLNNNIKYGREEILIHRQKVKNESEGDKYP